MSITQHDINKIFEELISMPDMNFLSKEGFIILSDWSEKQTWWHEFAGLNNMDDNWRNTNMGDPYQFALMLFRFIMSLRGYH